MPERWILDPAEMTEGSRVELDITPWIKVDGVDLGDAEIEAYRAQAQVGESVLDYRLPNRQIVAPLVIKDSGGTTFAKARSYIQAKAALCMREGMIGKHVLGTGGTVYFDVVAGGLTLGGDWLQANRGVDVNAELRMEAIPDFYEPEKLIAEAEEKTAAELIKVIPDPGGDLPARVRIEVTDKQGEAIKGLIWAFRSRHYSSASTAKTAYEAEALEPLGTSSKGPLSGASGGSVVSNTALPSVFTPVVNTGFLTHTGTNRVFVRLRSPDGTAVSGQFSWDVGDLVNPSVNEAFAVPGGSAFFILDAGEVRLDPPPVGNHRWQGRFDFKGAVGGEDVQVDKVWIVNADEGMGILSAPPQPTVGTLTAWDNFNSHTAGTITGKVASLGGTWTGAGDAVGFTIDTTIKAIKREEKSDASSTTGYFARLGAGVATTVDVSLDVKVPISSNYPAYPIMGSFARYSNASNWMLATYIYIDDNQVAPAIAKCVAGTFTYLENGPFFLFSSAEWRTLRMVVDSTGLVTLFEGPQSSSSPSPTLSYQDADLATGGALATGGYGIYDAYASASLVPVRTYDNFLVTVPTSAADAVIFASQKSQLTTQGVYRLDSGGTAYAPVSRVNGDLPRLPAGNLEGRSVELFVKTSAGDLEEVADSSIPDLAVKVYAARSWLTVPGLN